MRFLLISEEDPSIKRSVEVPNNIVVKKRKTSNHNAHVKKPKVAKIQRKNSINKSKPKKSINTSKTVQKTNSIIRKYG